MAEITIDRDAFEKIEAGAIGELAGEDRLAAFLANKFRDGEREASLSQEPSWVYNIWTFIF